MEHVLLGTGKLRLAPPDMYGPPKGPVGLRVSATRHGVTGTYRSPLGEETLILALVPLIDEVTTSVALSVCVPTVASEAENVPLPLVNPASAGSVARLSVLVKWTGSVKVVTVLLLAFRAVIVNRTGTPAVAVVGATTEKWVTVPPPDEIVTVAPVAETDMADPGREEDTGFRTCTLDDDVCVVLDIVRPIVATRPLDIVLEFIPHTRHVMLPAVELHDTALPAVVAALPAVTATAEKSEVE
jgi:hypothetical protein